MKDIVIVFLVLVIMALLGFFYLNEKKSPLNRYEKLTGKNYNEFLYALINDVSTNGVGNSQALWISFKTDNFNVRMPDHLKELYPKELTIVLEHQFDNLVVTKDRFEVTVYFEGKPARLVIPFIAVMTVHDPYIDFTRQRN